MIETIEWFQAPAITPLLNSQGEDPEVLVKLSHGEVTKAFLQDGQWRDCADASMIPNGGVLAWAHMPKGPEAAKRGRGRHS